MMLSRALKAKAKFDTRNETHFVYQKSGKDVIMACLTQIEGYFTFRRKAP
jgi:hypothetical protein